MKLNFLLLKIAHLALDLMAVIPGVLLPHNPQQRMRIRMGVHLLIVDVATLVEDKDGGTSVDRPNQLTVTGQMNTAGKYAWGSLD